MKRSVPRILFAGGGTGGHVYPAIAIADAVKRLAPDTEIVFAGTRDRLEWQAVPQAGYAIHPITISGLQRSLSIRNLSFPIKLVQGLFDSWQLVRHMQPDVAVGTGGYVSGPVLLTARLAGTPYLIQEQNAYAGLTNRLLARWASEIHVAFEEAKGYLEPEKCVLSGNPIRKELSEATDEEGRQSFDLPPDARVLFAFGGSLGSRALNEVIESKGAELLEDERVHILWQTGPRYFEEVAARLAQHERLQVFKYVNRIEHAYAAADLVLCRAGAITCSELMATRTPAVLVPSPNVVADHQTKNARSMENGGAAVLLPENELASRIVDVVRNLLLDDDRRRAMSDAASSLAQPEAADYIARRVLALAGYPEKSPVSETSD